MTVKELIEKLQRQNPEAIVHLDADDYGVGPLLYLDAEDNQYLGGAVVVLYNYGNNYDDTQ